MPMNILPVLIDGMWAQLQYGSEFSEFSVTFSISYSSFLHVPAYMGTVAKKLLIRSVVRDSDKVLTSESLCYQHFSVNVDRFWEKCMTPVFFQTLQSIRKVNL